MTEETEREEEDTDAVTLCQSLMSGTEEEYGTEEDNVDLQSRPTKRRRQKKKSDPPSSITRPSKDATSNSDIR